MALGDYHVQYQVDERVWYAGALEYVSPNFWGDRRLERELGLGKEPSRTNPGAGGKGWLLVDLESGKVDRRPIAWARPVLDLDPIEADGLSAPALDAQIAERVDKIAGGIEGKIVRLKVYNVPRHIARELDHAAIRAYKAAALHFRLDLRRPDCLCGPSGSARPAAARRSGAGPHRIWSSGRCPPHLDREEFVRLGTELIEVVEPDLAPA